MKKKVKKVQKNKSDLAFSLYNEYLSSNENENEEVETLKSPINRIKRNYSSRFYMMIMSAAVIAIGLFMFVLYFATLNIVIGLPGTILIVIGVFLLRHYWQKEEALAVEFINPEQIIENANSLNIYKDKVAFENLPKPEGFPQMCKNLGKRFYVHIWDSKDRHLIPFVLPDQQYYDPQVFAQRVLELPAHRKIFERKKKLLEKLKTAMLVLAIAIVWLLILTTTQQGGA